MARKSYKTLLQDARWQKKRLEVFNRAGWVCEWCGDDENNLQVHHGYYPKNEKGKMADPWEAPDDVLYCLCKDSHEQAEVLRQAIYLELGRIHPKHHAHVLRLLRQVREVIAEDPELLEEMEVEAA